MLSNVLKKQKAVSMTLTAFLKKNKTKTYKSDYLP